MIKVECVTKTFKLYRYPGERLKELLFKKKYHHKFTAVKNMSMTVENGETVGIIGRNGAGKSTFLKLLTGVLIADSGTIAIDGKITGLLELGTGFNQEFSGRENIYLNATYSGLSREEVDARLDEIIAFSELGQYINEPLKTYSSGMAMRLAFATAIHSNPDAFVVDEALSVGDAYFQQKCVAKIKQFKENGGAIIFVSHDLNAVKVLCDRAVLLEQGEVVAEGEPELVINTYNRRLSITDSQESSRPDIDKNYYGNLKVAIEKLELIGEDGREIKVVVSGQRLIIRFHLSAEVDVGEITIGLLFRDKFGQDIYGTNTRHLGENVVVERGQQKIVEFAIEQFNFGPGKYSLTVALHTQETHIDECYHWIDRACSFAVVLGGSSNFTGICDLRARLIK